MRSMLSEAKIQAIIICGLESSSVCVWVLIALKYYYSRFKFVRLCCPWIQENDKFLYLFVCPTAVRGRWLFFHLSYCGVRWMPCSVAYRG